MIAPVAGSVPVPARTSSVSRWTCGVGADDGWWWMGKVRAAVGRGQSGRSLDWEADWLVMGGFSSRWGRAGGNDV